MLPTGELGHYSSIVGMNGDLRGNHVGQDGASVLDDSCGGLITAGLQSEDVHVLRYEFRIVEAEEDYFRVVLTAAEGPLDTRDYALELEAIPLATGGTFVHLGYACHYGFGTRMFMAGYFATSGSDKVGFSVVGADAKGNPVYVDGIEGLMERNSVRYQLAIQAYLDTLAVPEGQRFERRIARWFDLTERFRPQLFELEQEEYLRNKRRERSDQLRLQQALTAETRWH